MKTNPGGLIPTLRSKAFPIACGLVLLCLGGVAKCAEPPAKRPNILFIAIDDQNDWIGCLGGHPQAKTPNIDRLAARGTLFTNAHCQAPLCNPSRTSVLTGLRPSTTGIYGLAPWFRTVESLESQVSLPQYFAQHGYRNYSTGKVYHDGYGRGKQDHEFDVLGPTNGGSPKPPQKLVDTPAKIPGMDWGTFPHRDEDKGDWKVASWASEQLKTLQAQTLPKGSAPAQPFFLSVGFSLPHVPCFVTKSWYDMVPEESLELPPFLENDRDDTPRFSWYLHWKLPEPRLKFLREAHQWKNLVRSYLASTSFVDSQIGRVLDALDSSGMADNTIVVLWSDHGWHLGEKSITGKNTLWERSTRVPLIFAGPGVASGARCTQPVELLDIYPTLATLCGLPVSETTKGQALEGHSLVPQLRDAAAVRAWPAITTHNRDNHTIRTDRWRYIRYADGSEELYDMSADPNEWRNLAADPQYAGVIRQQQQWLPKVNVPAAPGSKHRILIYENGHITWEGEPVDPHEPVPEL
jgi:choline-sulfatase